MQSLNPLLTTPAYEPPQPHCPDRPVPSPPVCAATTRVRPPPHHLRHRPPPHHLPTLSAPPRPIPALHTGLARRWPSCPRRAPPPPKRRCFRHPYRLVMSGVGLGDLGGRGVEVGMWSARPVARCSQPGIEFFSCDTCLCPLTFFNDNLGCCIGFDVCVR